MNRLTDKLIKILSLGIGLAIGIVLIGKVCFELSYDGFYKDVDRIYRITENIIHQKGDDPSDYSCTSGAIAPGFKAEVPGVPQMPAPGEMKVYVLALDGQDPVFTQVVR